MKLLSTSWGGAVLTTFLDFLDASSDLTGLTDNANQMIQQLGDIISRQPIDRKRGPIEDKISKLLVYGDKQMPGAQIRIGG